MWTPSRLSRKMSPLRFGLLASIVISLVFVTGTRGEYGANCGADTCAADECYCGDIPAVTKKPDSYDPDKTCYVLDEEVYFSCDGTLSGPPLNPCGSGGSWLYPSGPTCEPASTCPKPSTPTNGSITPDPDVNDEYDLYQTIFYHCDEGFTRVGPSQAVCGSGEEWSPSNVPVCEPGCDAPTLPNGYTEPNTTFFDHGQVANFYCNENFTLVGISKSTCRQGVYDPSELPTCYEKCDPPIVPNSDFSQQKDWVDHKGTITVKCDTGYSTGSGTEYDMTCDDGAFDADDPTCFQNCPALATFENGERTGDTTPFYHTESVAYTCNTGYTLVGSSSIYCDNGNWNDSQPVCKENCNVGPVADSDYATQTEEIHGTTFNITCDVGFSTGTSRATEMACDDGTVTPNLPTCYADCQPPIVDYSDHRTQQPDVYHNTVITITCWSNYSIDSTSNNAEITCDDGDFGDIPICYENCEDVSAPANGIITAGESPFYHEEGVSFQCNVNYTLVGSEFIFCSDGNWNDSVPTCEEMCERPVIDNSDATSPTPLLDHDEDITVSCNNGYSNGKTQDFTSTCTEGTLEPAVPLCYQDCVPPVVTNSNYSSQESDVYHTTTIYIACDPGYSTGSPGVYPMTCTDGAFDEAAPTCSASCTPPVVEYSDYNTQQPDLLYGEDITITCWANYSSGPDSQTIRLSCGDIGLIGDEAVCYENCAGPRIPNSDFSDNEDGAFHQANFTVTCDSGFANGIGGPTFVLTCNNGAIEGDPTCYANCPDITGIDNGGYSGATSPYYHDEQVTFTCNTNYTLEGSATLTCDDGEWNNEYPSCKSDCLPPVIENSDYGTQQPQVDHNVDVTITCDGGFSVGPEETQTITCNDGSFSPDPSPCLADCTPPIVANSDYDSQQDDVSHTDSFTVTCNTNYTVGDGTPTATLTCSDGDLSDTVTCYVNCPDPGTPENGDYDIDMGGFYHNAVVTYFCDTNYDLNGEDEITCDNGDWSGGMPNCTDMSLYDRIMLTCGPTSMEVEIPKGLLHGIGPEDIGLEGDLTCLAYEDGDLYRVNTSLAGCGTNKTENATHDIYQNRVVNNYYSDIITRVVDVQIPMTCIYERNAQVRAVRYSIEDYVIGKELIDIGTYDMTFKIYNDSQYTNAFAEDAAVNIDINTELFFKLELITDVTDNQLVPQNCWSTPEEDSESTPQHILLRDRCPEDETFVVEMEGGTVYEFRLKSFRFVDDDNREVFVHCTVYVCHSASTDDFCQPCDTPSARRKRDLIDADENGQAIEDVENDDETRDKREVIHDPVVKHVKAGPIRWKSEAEIDEIDVGQQALKIDTDTSESDSTSSWMYSVVGLGVVTVVFSVILIAVVKHYRERLQKKGYKYQQLSVDS